MSSLTKKYEKVYKGIIRPYRETYSVSELGPDLFEISGKTFTRRDFSLKNQRNLNIQCSFYTQSVPIILPCVIYLHTYNSSRLEALPILPVLLPSNINVLTLDFSGSGNSDGEFISLGWHEREDLQTVVNYLRTEGKTTCIGLWGKGTGAVTALLFADRDPSIGGMVLDSPFLSLRLLSEEKLQKHCNLPGFIKNTAIQFIRNSILKSAQFDVNDLNTLEHVVHTFIPCIFCRALNDDFIGPAHLTDLFQSYPGEKKLVTFEGTHNSRRPSYFLDSVAIFFYNCLLCETIELPHCTIENPPINNKENKPDSDDSYELL